MAASDQFSIDLAREAIARCLATSHYDAADIDLLILCSICRYDGPGMQFSYEPNSSFQLAHDLNLVNAQTLDVSNACAGMFTGIAVARALISSGAVRNAIVASGENITHISQTAQKEIAGIDDSRLASLTLGDAAAAVLLERSSSDEVGFHDLELYTLSEHSKLCIAHPTSRSHGGVIMFTDSPKMASVAVQNGVQHSHAVMERNGWSIDDVNHWVIHQISRRATRNVKRETETTLERGLPAGCNLVDNVSERGNTATTTHFVALADEIAAGRINSGDKILFSVAASGLTIGTGLYTMDDLPGRVNHRRNGSSQAVNGRKPIENGRSRRLEPIVRVESIGLPDEADEPRDDFEYAKEAIENCLDSSRYDRTDIGLLIFCGVYRSGFVFEPAIASLLAGELGIGTGHAREIGKKKVLAFDVFNGAAGFLWACDIAAHLIRQSSYKAAMIVASEFPGNSGEQPAGERRIAQTASATILDRETDGSGFSDFMFHNFFEYRNAFTSRLWMGPGITEIKHTADGDITNAYIDCITRSLKVFEARTGTKVSEANYILGPQISTAFSSALSSAIGLPLERIVDVQPHAGDLLTSSFVHSMHHLRHRGRVNSGDFGIVISAGPGVNIGCASYRF
ncbi:MAG TPA: 3-oxoacyl-[acyl-carrier-protein] synthase III C-terminal domain-containing protein [Candidatus Binataceae bacterium]|nr:3-oxoacyl-[acyl-carrier-protein] synthase III C-terminal domain-containing protein [Candidatus Binataceae bacterium]